MKYIPLIISFILFVLLCVSSSYWVMRLLKPEARKVTIAQETPPVADVESVAGLFGGAMLVDTNYQLKGVVQANPMNQSVAIIAIDGKSTKAYPFHTEINSGSALNEVYSNYVLLLDNGVSKRVDLPKELGSPISEMIHPLSGSQPSDSQSINTTHNAVLGNKAQPVLHPQGPRLSSRSLPYPPNP